jgi:anti-sigma regulatory factor (Ser/Thr protein kinase)
MKDEKLYLDSTLVNLSRAREFIARKAREAGASEADTTKIEISCDEWSANIIEHAHGEDSTQGFTISCSLADGRFVVVFENEGSRFNPIEQEDVDLDDHYDDEKERGLGLYIMKETMDEIHYEYLDDTTNKLTLVKILGSITT